MLVHVDAEAARINAGRLEANLAEDGRQNADVRRDGTVQASMGVTVTLESVQGTELEVKAVAVHEPATPDEEANKEALPSEAEAGPRPDTRLVAVELAAQRGAIGTPPTHGCSLQAVLAGSRV